MSDQAAFLLSLTKKIAELARTFPCIEGYDNSECRLNESADTHELCLPHLADAVLTRLDKLTVGEKTRLGIA